MSTTPSMMCIKSGRRATVVVGPLAATLLLAAPLSWAEGLTDDLAAAIADSTVNLNFRYRFETVDDDAFAKDAWANTLRSRLTVAPKPVSDFGVLIEVDDVRHIGADNFNDSRNGVTDRPGVTDPEGTDLNQALLRYTGFTGTEITVGRQRILRANHRFIGNVGWRQNEQTFDAFTARLELGKRVTLTAAFINNVNTVFGESHPTRGDVNVDSELLHVAAKIPGGTLIAYAHLIEMEDSPQKSHRNFGLRYDGKHAFGDAVDLLYTGEYADQSDFKDGASSIDASYYFAELGVRWQRLTAKAGYEVLGSNDGLTALPHRLPRCTSSTAGRICF